MKIKCCSFECMADFIKQQHKPWILVKRDDAVWLSLRKKRINTSD